MYMYMYMYMCAHTCTHKLSSLPIHTQKITHTHPLPHTHTHTQHDTGYRLMKIVLFLIGFLVGGSITYFIIIAFVRDRPESWLPYVAIGAAVVVGILCGLLTICIYYIGLFLAGGSVGFLIVWFILSAINVEFFHTHIYVPIIIAVVCGIIAGVITLIVQKWFFMFGITVLGSFLIIWGLDYYLELGSMIYFLFLFAEHRAKFKPCWYSWIIIPLFIILCISGFLIQACLTGRKYDHKKDFNGEFLMSEENNIEKFSETSVCNVNCCLVSML